MGSIYIKSKMDLNKIIESTIRQFLNEDINVKDLVLYHGTKKDFNEFDLRFFNSGSSDGGWLGYGIYLTNDYKYAESYGDVLECKVNISNSYILEDYLYSISPLKLMNKLGVDNSRGITKKLIDDGYDSVMLRYNDGEWYGDFIELCVFNPSDIKIIKRYEHGDESYEVNQKRGYN